jgi:hypothetical protein
MPFDALVLLRGLSRHATAMRVLSFAQSDRHGSHIGACLWPCRDRLPFTLGPYVETGREAGASHIRDYLRTAHAARNISRHGDCHSQAQPQLRPQIPDLDAEPGPSI